MLLCIGMEWVDWLWGYFSLLLYYYAFLLLYLWVGVGLCFRLVNILFYLGLVLEMCLSVYFLARLLTCFLDGIGWTVYVCKFLSGSWLLKLRTNLNGKDLQVTIHPFWSNVPSLMVIMSSNAESCLCTRKTSFFTSYESSSSHLASVFSSLCFYTL